MHEYQSSIKGHLHGSQSNLRRRGSEAEDSIFKEEFQKALQVSKQLERDRVKCYQSSISQSLDQQIQHLNEHKLKELQEERNYSENVQKKLQEYYELDKSMQQQRKLQQMRYKEELAKQIYEQEQMKLKEYQMTPLEYQFNQKDVHNYKQGIQQTNAKLPGLHAGVLNYKGNQIMPLDMDRLKVQPAENSGRVMTKYELVQSARNYLASPQI